jgi:hypothetical protein
MMVYYMLDYYISALCLLSCMHNRIWCLGNIWTSSCVGVFFNMRCLTVSASSVMLCSVHFVVLHVVAIVV